MKRRRLSRYLVASPPARIGHGQPSRVVLATRTGTRMRVGVGLWDALQEGRIDELPGDVVTSLIEGGVLVDTETDELAAVLAENRSAIARNKVLEQVIQPTAACQLGCGYCGQEHRAVVMDEATQNHLVDAISSRLAAAQSGGSAYEQLNVGWFGAEPLLGLSAVRRLTPMLRQAADRLGVGYASHIITNGLSLTRSIARELALQHDVTRVEVTLDGPPSVHDSRRHTKSGHSTFDQIWANLLALAGDDNIDFELTIRCNVDATNADAVPELIDLIAASALAQRARLYFSPVYAWGNDADLSALDRSEYASREVAWMAQQIKAGLPVQLVPGRREIVCVAVQPDGRVVDAFGSEFTCTEVPYVPTYGTPNRYETGHVLLKSRRAHPLPFHTFYDSVASGDLGCAHCPLLPVCGGACPKSWQEGTPPCPSHKINLSERLLLEVAAERMCDGRRG